MAKIKRILSERGIGKKSKPFKILEQRLVESFMLDRKVIMSKDIPKSCKEHSKRQFIVFMISCLEDYLRNKFKLFVDKNLIESNELLKHKRLKNLKFNINELKTIIDKKIELSEIAATELNFQNFSDIIFFCDLIRLTEYHENILKDAKKKDFGFTKKESEDAVKKCATSLNKNAHSYDSYNKFIIMYIRNIHRFGKKEDLMKIIGTIKIAIELRHKIVHKAEKVKLPHDVFQIALVLAILRFISIIEEIYNIQLGASK